MVCVCQLFWSSSEKLPMVPFKFDDGNSWNVWWNFKLFQFLSCSCGIDWILKLGGVYILKIEFIGFIFVQFYLIYFMSDEITEKVDACCMISEVLVLDSSGYTFFITLSNIYVQILFLQFGVISAHDWLKLFYLHVGF